MIDPQRPDFVVGVLGAGTMGRGIAQVAAAAGMQVRLSDADDRQVEDAVRFIAGMLNRAAEKGRMPADDARAAIDRVLVVNGLDGFADCHLVIEAIVEDIEVKQRTFAELDRIVSRDSILATNTSSLSVTAIAARAERPRAHRRAALLQSSSADEACGSHRGVENGLGGGRRAARDRPSHGQARGPVQGHARIPGQPCRPGVRAGSASHRRRRGSASRSTSIGS